MKILFCSDGSKQAESAVRFGAIIAAGCKAECSILGIAEKPGRKDALLNALSRAQDFLKEHQLDAELIAKAGKPETEIVKRTKEGNYDLVIIGAVRKTSFWRSQDPLWMSVRAYNIIESVEPPVLVVIGRHPALRRILLCSSGSAFIDQAMKLTGKIAQDVKAVVDLFHVLPETPVVYDDLVGPEMDADGLLQSKSKLGRALGHQKNLLEQFGVFGEFRLRRGSVVTELLKESHRREYDLVVVGSMPAKERLRKYVMGDVAREIVNRAGLPVLVFRTGQPLIPRLFKGLLNYVFRRRSEASEKSNG
ncbi:MAG: universal stress protein [Desulfobaccales bacterium]